MNYRIRFVVLGLAFFALILMSGCGKIGRPVDPDGASNESAQYPDQHGGVDDVTLYSDASVNRV